MIEVMQKIATQFEDAKSLAGEFDRDIFGWYKTQRKQRTETRAVLPEGIVVPLG